jgi:hypothetical protein
MSAVVQKSVPASSYAQACTRAREAMCTGHLTHIAGHHLWTSMYNTQRDREGAVTR